MSRDPRVNLLIHGLPVDRPNYAGDGPNYVAISGTVELTDDPTGAFHQEMYDLHMGGAAPPPEPGAQRVTARIVPLRTYVPTFAAIFGAAGSADGLSAQKRGALRVHSLSLAGARVAATSIREASRVERRWRLDGINSPDLYRRAS